MAGRILVIREAAAPAVDEWAAALEALGVQTVQVSGDAGEIGREAGTADAFLVVAGERISRSPEVLQRLKELSLDGSRLLFAAGSQEELGGFEHVVPKTLIAGEFAMPMDAQQLAREVCRLMTANAQRKARKHILLVDDDVVFLQMMQKWLSSEFRVSILKTGLRVSDFARARTPDLILLDYDMPDMPGPEVLKALKGEAGTARIPVMFLTGKCDEESVARLGADGYLLKAAGRENILNAIRDFFAGCSG